MGKSQSPIVISTDNALSTEGTTNNVATNKAALAVEKAASANGKDITPTSVRTNSMYVTEGVISEGLMRSGSLLVGSGGVAITSDPEGGTPSGTGLMMSDSMLALTLTGETDPVVLLNGQDGSASFKGTVSAGSTVSADMTAGSIFVGSGGVSISSAADGAEPSNAGVFVGYLGSAPVVKLTDAMGAMTVLLDGSDGSATFTGDVTCTSLVASDSNAVNFGADITINGDLLIADSDKSGAIKFDGASGNRRLQYEEDIDTMILLNGTTNGKVYIQAGGGSSVPVEPYIIINDNASSIGVYGTTVTVNSLTIDSTKISIGSGAPTGGSDGDLYIRKSTTNSALHFNLNGTWKTVSFV